MMKVIALALCWVVAVPSLSLAQGIENARAGNQSFAAGDYETAVELFTNAIESNELIGDALAVTFNNRGVALGELGDFDRAIEDYERALVLKPEDATTLKNMRVALTRRGHASATIGEDMEALSDYQAAIDIDPQAALPYYHRGQLLAGWGDLEAARADLERAAALEPGNAEIEGALAQIEARIESAGLRPAEDDGAGSTVAEPATGAPGDRTIDPGAPPPRAADTASASRAAPAVAPPRDEPAAGAAPAARAQDAGPGEPQGRLHRAIASVNYRAGPSNDAARLGVLSEGAEIRVVGERLGWKRFILRSGQEAFIYERWLEPVEE